MDYYVMFLRFLHIGAGVFWVGSTLVLTATITPALKGTGESGQKFVDYLVKHKKFGTNSAGAGAMAGIAGLLLYWHDSHGLTSLWMRSGAGLGFGIGAIFGLIAFIFGVLTDRELKTMAELREQIEVAPSAEQTSQLQKLEKQQATYLKICAGTLTLSLWIMAISRYLVF